MLPLLLATFLAIGEIEFFGAKGIDLSPLPTALPVKADELRKLIAEKLHLQPTDIASVCCDTDGNPQIFIGLPGASYRAFRYLAPPTGPQRLPKSILNLYQQLDKAIEEAVRRGGEASQEDDSQGFALIRDPAARALQLQVRSWAIGHEPLLAEVLALSRNVEQRRVASDALGYATSSHRQILSLVHASSDPDSEVRNNATRALVVLVRSNPKWGAEIVPDTFVAMLNSGSWSDRNKSAALLDALTSSPNPDLLAKIRSSALASIVEMAAWKSPAHATFARNILARLKD